MATESGLESDTVQPAMAWAIASTPAWEVGLAGRPCVSTGSTSAACARICGWPKPILRSSSASVSTEAPETSLPVPLVVGHSTSGMRGATGVRRPSA